MKITRSELLKQTKRIALDFITVSVIIILSGQAASSQVPGAKFASLAYQKTTAFNPTEFRNSFGRPVIKYSDITDSDSWGNIPEFAMGSASEQYQASRMINYDAISKNANDITYALDYKSEKAGNTINVNTGEVTYVSDWSGITTITATAKTSNGKTFSSIHTVTVHSLPLASAKGNQTIPCNSTAIISGVTADNGSIKWTHNGKGTLTATNTLHPSYTAAAADAGKTISLTVTVRSYYEECGEKLAKATYVVYVK